jgi:hypothetical protein
MEHTKHYIKVSVSRELSDREFNALTDIVEDEVGDIVVSDDVHEYPDDNRQICYLFELGTEIENCEQGASALDIITFEIDQLLPSHIKWDIESE